MLISQEEYIRLMRSIPSPENRRKWRPAWDTYVRFENLINSMSGMDGKSVLDIGSGTGLSLVFWENRGCKVVGLDKFEHFYRNCRVALGVEKRILYYRIKPLCSMPFMDKSFDLVFVSWFAPYYEYTELEKDFFVKECGRIGEKTLIV